jgi:hypothetical protein
MIKYNDDNILDNKFSKIIKQQSQKNIERKNYN